MDYKAYALMAILLASVASLATVSTASAQSITVETDKTDYTTGDTITVSGNVGTMQAGQPVLIRVTNPQGAFARADQIDVAADGSFTYAFPAGGQYFSKSGEYTVAVTYSSRTEETTFSFTSTGGEGQGWKTIQVNIQGENHPVQYMITGSGNKLNGITADFDEKSFTAMLTAASDGTLSLKFPAETFDANDDFVAFADEIETVVDDNSQGTTNEIHIDFDAGTQEIVIVGDSMIPEFGAIAAIVLAIAIVGIIVATARYNNKFSSFVPRL